MPEATYIQATWKAVEELAQAFSVLMIGMPPMPMSRRATWPRIISWPVIRPAVALPTTATSSFFLSTPAESRAPLTASRGDVLHAAVQELPEVGHPRADDCDVSHGVLLSDFVSGGRTRRLKYRTRAASRTLTSGFSHGGLHVRQRDLAVVEAADHAVAGR